MLPTAGAGKRVFIRADLNVPQDDAGAITDDTRIRASVPGIRFARDAGAAVMVISQLGRPTEGELKPEDSLAPIAHRLAELLPEVHQQAIRGELRLPAPPSTEALHVLEGVELRPPLVAAPPKERLRLGQDVPPRVLS